MSSPLEVFADEDDQVSVGKDNSSSHDPGLSKSSTTKDGDAGEMSDSICMKRSGLIILALVAIMAGIAGAATYLYASNNEQDEFESEVSQTVFLHITFFQNRRFSLLFYLLISRSKFCPIRLPMQVNRKHKRSFPS